MNMEREEMLFLAIGGVPDAMVAEAASPEGPRKKKPLRHRWMALAACLALVAGLFPLLSRIGGNGSGAGISSDTAPGEAVFFSYAGPVLSLTTLDGPQGLPATREVTWDFAGGQGEQNGLFTVTVTDATAITNDRDQDLTFTVAYPVTGDLRTQGALLPSLEVDGTPSETGLLWGDRSNEEPLWRTPRLESWEDVRLLLEDGSCLTSAQQQPPALEQTVTVWELTESTAPETGQGAPTMAIRFQIDEEKTRVFTWGFNGGEFGEDGQRRYSYFVPQQQERDSSRFLIFLGEVPKTYTMEGYENGACKEPLEGVTAQISAFTTSLGELADRLVEESRDSFHRLEEGKAAVRRLFARLLSPGEERDDSLTTEDLLSRALTCTRVIWTTAEISIPAGETVTVTARFQKEPSYDFACTGTEKQGLYGFDLGTRLGSSLAFQKTTARLKNTRQILLVRNDFGFDQQAGVLEAELSPGQEHCAMEVRLIPTE